MKIHEMDQGSPEWAALRREFFCASDAPAIMGQSPYETRAQYIRRKISGLDLQTLDYVKKLKALGHEAERHMIARAEAFLADQGIDSELYPTVASATIEGLPMLASLDGLSMGGEILWENKIWNKQKIADIEAGKRTCDYYQVQHQMMVTGAGRCLYTLGDQDGEKARHYWIERDEAEITKLIAAWKLAAEEIARGEAPAEVAPAVAVVPQQMLPALNVRVTAAVEDSNVSGYCMQCLDMIGAMNTDLQTDADFARAEADAKFCQTTEKKINQAVTAIRQQMGEIDEIFTALEHVSGQARARRLELSKLVRTQKDALKAAIVQRAQADGMAYAQGLQAGRPRQDCLEFPAPALGDAGKGKRTMQSFNDAVHQALSDWKIEAAAAIARADANVKILNEAIASAPMLARIFANRQAAMRRETEDLRNLIAGEVARIEKAEAEARAKAEAEARAADEADEAASAIEAAEIAKEREQEAREKARAARAVADARRIAQEPQPEVLPRAPDTITIDDLVDVVSARWKVSRERAKMWLWSQYGYPACPDWHDLDTAIGDDLNVSSFRSGKWLDHLFDDMQPNDPMVQNEST